MEEEATVRKATLDAIGGVEPTGLQERIRERLRHASTVPGVFVALCAHAITDTPGSAADQPLPPHVARRAAGVQLIYDGLRLTRQLAHEEPWDTGSGEEADLDILAADVLVAEGFYLLARTEAANEAVETVRAFGRDQTIRRQADDPALDRNLEADVLELAAVAGATADGAAVTPQFREYASELADSVDPESAPFPVPDQFFPANVRERLVTLASDHAGGESVPSSVDD